MISGRTTSARPGASRQAAPRARRALARASTSDIVAEVPVFHLRPGQTYVARVVGKVDGADSGYVYAAGHFVAGTTGVRALDVDGGAAANVTGGAPSFSVLTTAFGTADGSFEGIVSLDA